MAAGSNYDTLSPGTHAEGHQLPLLTQKVALDDTGLIDKKPRLPPASHGFRKQLPETIAALAVLEGLEVIGKEWSCGSFSWCLDRWM